MSAKRVLLPVLTAVLLQGCYVYTPLVSAAPTPGARYTFEITDPGRIGLADRLGSGVEKVEGTLVGQEGDAYLVSVSGVETINAGTSHWSGERVTIRQGFVNRIQQRQFSKGRTAVAIGSTAVALGVFIVTRNLLGNGEPSATPGTGPQNGS